MKPATPAPTAKADPSLATIEVMIADLAQMRDRERVKDVRGAYQLAINRLHSLVHRLNQPRPRTVGLPAPAATPAPEPPAAPPQRSLPLGPVVVAPSATLSG